MHIFLFVISVRSLPIHVHSAIKFVFICIDIVCLYIYSHFCHLPKFVGSLRAAHFQLSFSLCAVAIRFKEISKLCQHNIEDSYEVGVQTHKKFEWKFSQSIFLKLVFLWYFKTSWEKENPTDYPTSFVFTNSTTASLLLENVSQRSTIRRINVYRFSINKPPVKYTLISTFIKLTKCGSHKVGLKNQLHPNFIIEDLFKKNIYTIKRERSK